MVVVENIKVIKGTKKGMCGTVSTEGRDYVIMTKDFYGKSNNGRINASLHLIKVLKKNIKLFHEQYEETTEEQITTQYTDLFSFYKNKVMDLYTLVKFSYFQNNNNDNNYKQFNSLYSIALSVFNNMRTNDLLVKENMEQMKKEFVSSKKELIALKKAKKNKQFIALKKDLQKKQTQLKKLAVELKSLSTVDNKFIIEDSELVNTSEQYNHYVKASAKVVKSKKAIKMTKKIVKKVIDEETTKVTNMMADLLS